MWMNSKKTLSQVFTDWMPGQPNNYNHDQGCLVLYQGGSYHWEDESCEGIHNYICVTVVPTAITVVG